MVLIFSHLTEKYENYFAGIKIICTFAVGSGFKSWNQTETQKLTFFILYLLTLKLHIMKKATAKALQAMTTNQLTIANLNKVSGKIEARKLAKATDDGSYMSAVRAEVKKEFKEAFEARTWQDVNAGNVRVQIALLTVEDVESTRTASGDIRINVLVNKCIARAHKAEIKSGKEKAKADKERAKARKEANKQLAPAVRMWGGTI